MVSVTRPAMANSGVVVRRSGLVDGVGERRAKAERMFTLMDGFLKKDPLSLQKDILNHVEYTVARSRFNFDDFEAYQVIPDEEATRAVTQTYELAEECLQINYYGTKITIESLMPLLQLSDSPRIVNVSSTLGQLEVSFNLLEKYLEAHSKASMWENELLDVGYQPLCIQIPYTLEAFQPGKRGAVVGLVEEKHFILLS
ncbi:uncharacterized protein LOC108343809 isoform X1 [Vigna angularis]|uniref:uncharacterized protein LOC108343809 isoform X1 n=1 Tax=Phaseolus angularis TaxID=3914 RepID=UPI0022B58A44|nr:uncharacterized protein LOC108343809 isoform X1 [Vigna angularis]XP_052723046.1 uncharacterized protein LOC108343809 isoform X1 [Vigna angularis]XP_052723047.1 uncharacterized protein LOC108343809 isoform X1 [Vigna angularis]XP_052723048.1 uncharacterized protein LOC108343809 isoform X1 [Vigna angularis]